MFQHACNTISAIFHGLLHLLCSMNPYCIKSPLLGSSFRDELSIFGSSDTLSRLVVYRLAMIYMNYPSDNELITHHYFVIVFADF